MQTLVIERGRAEKNYWRDLYNYRELFLILAWRDVTVRYKQTVAGAAWAIVQPLLSIILFTVIFGKMAGLHSDLPYPVMVCAGMLPWQFFANALSLSSQSVVNNSNLISKIYFPRLIVPSSSVVVSFIDFLVACVILAGLMAWYHVWPTWHLLALPVLVMMAIATALGPGFIATALMVRFRDFRMIMPFVVQFGQFACPVAYESARIHDKFGDKWFFVYSLNPMVSVIDGFRWAIGDTKEIYLPAFALSTLVTVVLLVVGIKYFRKTERKFADII